MESVLGVEREMNRNQRMVVDGCFEEGHYEQGISFLDQLRTQNIRPSPAHIRQLIYIALIPPSHESYKTPSRDVSRKSKRSQQELGSPRKRFQEIQKSTYMPSAEASKAAWALLTAFAMTNTPESLLRAIPCYCLTETELGRAPRVIKIDLTNPRHLDLTEDDDSHIAKQAMRLRDCKDCWSILQSDAIDSKQDPQKTRRLQSRSFDRMSEDEDSIRNVVGEDSWRLLEWFIQLFEKDQDLVALGHEEPYSVLLLSQIKPGHADLDGRSDTSALLEIIIFCYNQSRLDRRALGKRLMVLLINLTSSPDFVALKLISTTASRLRACPKDIVINFFDDLPCDQRGFAFKLALCDRYLSQALAHIAGSKSSARRPVPKARSVRSAIAEDEDSGHDKRYTWSLPTSARILQLLDMQKGLVDQQEWVSTLTVLFHMVSAFGSMINTETLQETDHTWYNMLWDKQLEHKIVDAFSSETIPDRDKVFVQQMRGVLVTMCSVWNELHVSKH